jgi:hypothetical protein
MLILNSKSFFFTTNWVPRFVLRFFHSNDDNVDLFAARWLLLKVFEFSNNDEVAGFDPASDAIVTANEHRVCVPVNTYIIQL